MRGGPMRWLLLLVLLAVSLASLGHDIAWPTHPAPLLVRFATGNQTGNDSANQTTNQTDQVIQQVSSMLVALLPILILLGVFAMVFGMLTGTGGLLTGFRPHHRAPDKPEPESEPEPMSRPNEQRSFAEENPNHAERVRCAYCASIFVLGPDTVKCPGCRAPYTKSIRMTDITEM